MRVGKKNVEVNQVAEASRKPEAESRKPKADSRPYFAATFTLCELAA
jgi:hypothetical protein